MKSDLMKIQKLAKDKTALKHHLKVTRHNNGVLKNMVEELRTKNEKIEDHLQETKAKVLTGNNELAILKKQTEELKINNEEVRRKYENVKTEFEEVKTKNEDLMLKSEDLQSKNEDLKSKNEDLKFKNEELKVKNEVLKTKIENHEDKIEVEETTIRQCRSENVSNRKLIQELKNSQSEMTSSLEDCKTKDADLLISKEELKECLEELDAEMRKNLQRETTTTSTTTTITTTPSPKSVLVLSSFRSSNKPMVVSFQGQLSKLSNF